MGNTVFGQSAAGGIGINGFDGFSTNNLVIRGNVVYSNSVGISSDGLVDGNRVFNNTEGIVSRGGFISGSAVAQNNKVYSNQVGIDATGTNGTALNNVIYANTNQGILVENGSNGYRVSQNTIFQPVGDAVHAQGNSPNTKVRGNILDVLLGSPLSVTADSTSGLVNANNLTTDPLFVDPDGADNVLRLPFVRRLRRRRGRQLLCRQDLRRNRRKRFLELAAYRRARLQPGRRPRHCQRWH